MNRRHQDLIAKVNAGTLTAEQARQYSETLKPSKRFETTLHGPNKSLGWHCECGQCLPKSDAELIHEANQIEANKVGGERAALFVVDEATDLQDQYVGRWAAKFFNHAKEPIDKTTNGGGMYERFTDRARKVMQLANQEAQRFNHEYIGAEHILVGLCKGGEGVGCNVLRNLDVNLMTVIKNVRDMLQEGPPCVAMGKMPITPRAKKVIEHGMSAARRLEHNYVGTEHLLLGLLAETEGVASEVLRVMGVRSSAVMEQIKLILSSKTEPTGDEELARRFMEVGVDPTRQQYQWVTANESPSSSGTGSGSYPSLVSPEELLKHQMEQMYSGSQRWLGAPGMEFHKLEAAVQIDGSVKGLIFSTHLDVRHEPVNYEKVKANIKGFLAKCGLEHVEVLVCCGMGVQAVVK